eukprot:gene1935-3755_t
MTSQHQYNTSEVANHNVHDDHLYDVLLKVPSHGIHSPWNLHAFRAHTSLIPGKCSMCQGRIYPFTSVAYCVRCNCSVHRHCVLLDHVICDKFLLGPTKTTKKKGLRKKSAGKVERWGVEGEFVGGSSIITSNIQKNKVQVAHAVVTPIASTLDPSIVDSTAVENTPAPGSKDCIWRNSLRSIAKKFNLSRTISLPADPLILETFITSLISDITSFPGTVCQTLRSIYLELEFENCHLELAHARECLDNISCAVLTVLPADIAQDKDKLLVIVNAVDRKVLSTNDNAMYEKVWNAAQRLEAPADTRLKKKMLAVRTEQKNLQLQSVHTEGGGGSGPGSGSDDIDETVIAELSAVGSALTSLDKLHHLVLALRAVARHVAGHGQSSNTTTTTTPPSKSMHSSENNGRNRNRSNEDRELSTQSEESSETGLGMVRGGGMGMTTVAVEWDDGKGVEQEMEMLQDMNVDADTLMQRFIAILVNYECDELDHHDQHEHDSTDDGDYHHHDTTTTTHNSFDKDRSFESDNMGVELSTPLSHRTQSQFQIQLQYNQQSSSSSSIRKTKRKRRRKKLYWHAECNFIASLCRENDWLLGAEGYAMVTLQQALISLCPNSEIDKDEDVVVDAADDNQQVNNDNNYNKNNIDEKVKVKRTSPSSKSPEFDANTTTAASTVLHPQSPSLSQAQAQSQSPLSQAQAQSPSSYSISSQGDGSSPKSRNQLRPQQMSRPLIQRRAYPVPPANMSVPVDSE